VLSQEDGWFNLSVQSNLPRRFNILFQPTPTKMETLQRILSQTKATDLKLNEWKWPSDYYMIQTQKIFFTGNDGQRRPFLIPQNKTAMLSASKMEMYNSPLNVTLRKANTQFAFSPNHVALLSTLTSMNAPTLAVVTCSIPERFYSTQAMLLDMIIFACSNGSTAIDITWQYNKDNTINLTMPSTSLLLFPLGDFDLNMYLSSDLITPRSWQQFLLPSGPMFYFWMAGNSTEPLPQHLKYIDFVADTLLNKLGMCDEASFSNNAPLIILDYPTLSSVNNISDDTVRHLVISRRNACGFGDLWGSLSDVFLICKESHQVNGAYVPLTRVNLSLAAPYALAIGNAVEDAVPVNNVGGLASLTFDIVDLKQDPVLLTNGYPSVTIDLTCS
jgi:hypothetical protein